MAASGIDTINPKFPGPHVGSYYNKLFKKAVLESECPKVIFLDENKLIDKPFISGDCYSVCDEGGASTWGNILNNKPIAIAIACYADNKEKVEKTLKQLKFKIALSKHYNKHMIKCEDGIDICNRFKNVDNKTLNLPNQDICTIIAANDRFQTLWKK